MMRERSDCEKVIVRILEAILNYTVSDMKVKVVMGMCGNSPFRVQYSKQTTLHDYADIGISRNEDEMYNHLDITINKAIVTDPEIGKIICSLLDAVERKTEQFRLMK